MKSSIKSVIYEAIIYKKWLAINYLNKDNQTTSFYLAITNIDSRKNIIRGDSFNQFKNLESLNVTLKIDSIKSAHIIEQTYYDVPKNLINKIEQNTDNIIEFLDSKN